MDYRTVWIAGLVLAWCLGSAAGGPPSPPDAVDFDRQVRPLLVKYCGGCHGANEANAELRLDSWEGVMRGSENGAVLVPGQAQQSKLVQLLAPNVEGHMPPEDEPQPSEKERRLMVRWVAAGAARGAAGSLPMLDLPDVPAANVVPAVTALAVDPHSRQVMVGRFGQVESRDAESLIVRRVWKDLPGKVYGLAPRGDARRWLAATGIEGLVGQIVELDLQASRPTASWRAHADAVQAIAVSPDGKWWATGGHDRVIMLWDAKEGKTIAELRGHNGAIYALAFSPDSRVLASASGDETLKIWDVTTRKRVDTLGQPQGEQYCVAFSPDGRRVIGGGADNRLRVWQRDPRNESTHPLEYARFAHQEAVVQCVFSPSGRWVATASEDRSIKIWDTRRYLEVAVLAEQSDVPSSLVWDADERHLYVGRLDGSLDRVELPSPQAPRDRVAAVETAPTGVPRISAPEPVRAQEQEPNDEQQTANPLTLPGEIVAKLSGTSGGADADWYRFKARRGERWIFETFAAREKSPADTKIEIFDAHGSPVPRVQLQAIRDSHITFRGIDSKSIDIRVQNWEEMDLNQYLYLNGEVARLFLYPRGPDSGFQLDYREGRRLTFFETTALAHALHEPCYVVEPLPIDARPIPNGLPTFMLYYENDDDRERRWKGDSYLTFDVPADGEYAVRVTDVRGLSGDAFRYRLVARLPQPDFRAQIRMPQKKVNRGSGKEFEILLDRRDGFEGPVRIDIQGFPQGWFVTSPLEVERGRFVARGCVLALASAQPLSEDDWRQVRVKATAQIGEEQVVREVQGLAGISLAPPPKLRVALSRVDDAEPFHLRADSTEFPQPDHISIRPGTTTTVKLTIERHGFAGRVQFESLKLNLPHGVYVDNIGLNGVLIPEGQNERIVFLTAAKWVQPSSRLIAFKANQEGTQTSFPIWLDVVADDRQTASRPVERSADSASTSAVRD